MNYHRDLAGADFGDRRLSQRLLEIVERLAPSPEASFPEAMGNDSALEGTYRFLRNEAVTPAHILAPHIAATVERAAAAKTVIVPHDTTEIRFSTYREGLGRLNDRGHGFFAHFAIAVSAEGTKEPLGILGLETIFRREPVPKKHRRGADGEGRRWGDLVRSVSAHLAGRAQAIHVMDREADSYPLLSRLIADKERFVIRMRHDRSIEVPQPGCYWLADKLQLAEDLFVRDGVRIAARRRESVEKDRKAHPARQARTVQLAFSAVRVLLRCPGDLRGTEPKTLAVNVVHVREIDPPGDAAPVDWKLVTTEPIDTIEDVLAIVEFYRTRWTIEEFFKALKTGCGIEKRQLESHHSLLNALAIFAPIAAQLLALRHLARNAPSTPAETVLPSLRLRVMRAHHKVKLPANATVRDAMMAIARLGGHIKNNGEPGWLVLGRGYDKLLLLEEGAALALGM
jgi:Transposase DNA-binding/Transposase DDE domain